jgi:hypothetical protein
MLIELSERDAEIVRLYAGLRDCSPDEVISWLIAQRVEHSPCRTHSLDCVQCNEVAVTPAELNWNPWHGAN